jgi:hypothetical protein
MPQPVSRDLRRQPGTCCGRLHHAMHLRRIKMAAALGGKHGRIRAGRRPDLRQDALHADGQHDPGLAALAVDGRLPGIVPGLQVAPLQSARLADAQAAIDQAQQCGVPGIGFQRQHAMQIALGHDPLGERRLDRGQLDHGADVERGVAKPPALASRRRTGIFLAGYPPRQQ